MIGKTVVSNLNIYLFHLIGIRYKQNPKVTNLHENVRQIQNCEKMITAERHNLNL